MIVKSLLATAQLAAAIAIAQPAQAKGPLVLEPNSPWNLDYAEDSCALRRRFAPDNEFQTMVASSAVKMGFGSFKYRLTPDKNWQDPAGWHHLNFAEEQEGVIFSFPLVQIPRKGLRAADLVKAEEILESRDFLDREADAADKVTGLALTGAFRSQLVLDTGSLKKPLLALRTCIDELRSHWGIDLKAHETLTRPAVPTNRASIVSMINYPPEMEKKRMPGMVNIRLDIDEKGGITDCHIQMPLADPEFAKSSCSDLQHELDFEPALDKEGKPIASYWVTTVDFRMDW